MTDGMQSVQSFHRAKLDSVQQLYQQRLQELGFSSGSFANALAQRMASVSSGSADAAVSAYDVAVNNASTAEPQDSNAQMMQLMTNAMMMESMGSLTGGSSGSGGSSMSSMMAMMMMNNMLQQMSATQAAQQSGANSAVTGVQSASAAYESSSVVPVPAEYETLINKAASDYGVSPALIKGVMRAESGFRNGVVSSAGAQGLMQLMPGTAEYLGVTDSFDPAQNIDGGVRYLREMLDKYNGDIYMALAAYNCGPGRVSQLGVTSSSDDSFARLSDNVEAYVARVVRFADGYERVG